MAKLPTRESLGALPAVPTTPIASYDTTAIGRGAAALGRGVSAIGDAAETLNNLNERNQEFETERRFQEFKFGQQQALDQNMRQVEPGQVDGFADQWVQGYKQTAKQFFKTVPDNLKSKYDARLYDTERDFHGAASQFARHEQRRVAVNSIDDDINSIFLPRAQAGEPLENVKKDIFSTIKANPYLTPVEKEEAFRKKLDDIEEASIRGRIARREPIDDVIRDLGGEPVKPLDTNENPEARAKPFDGPAPEPRKKVSMPFSSGVNDAITAAAEKYGVDPALMVTFARIESGGRPGEQTGSYKGLYQLSEAEFRKHGGTGDIFDPVANADAAAAKLKAESADFENKYGKPPTALDLYLVHQQGEGGYAMHMQNPDAPAWQNMASTAEGRQKGAAWSKRAIWGNIPDDVKGKFPGGVETVTSAEFTKVWQDKVDRMGGGSGATTQTADQNMAASPYKMLSPAKRQTLLTAAIKVRDDERQQIADGERFHALVTGQLQADPSSKDDRDLIDNAVSATDVTKRLAGGDLAAAAQITAIATTTGYVPRAAVSSLRAMATNGGPEQQAFAYETVANIMRVKPGAFEGSEQVKKLADDARLYDALTVDTGATTTEALRRIAEIHTPEFDKRREALRPEADKLVKAITVSDVVGDFGGWFTRTPELGGSPREAGVILDAYRNLVRDRYTQTGDADVAKAMAKKDIQQSYNVSTVADKKRLMRFRPEDFYPAVAPKLGATPDISYFSNQLHEAVKEKAGKDIPLSDIYLEAIPETNFDVRTLRATGGTGRLPGYGVVWFEDRDGVKVMQTAPGLVFRADPKPEIARQSKEREASVHQIRSDEAARRAAIEQDPARRAFVAWRNEMSKQIEQQPRKPALRLRLPESARLPTNIEQTKQAPAAAPGSSTGARLPTADEITRTEAP